MGFADFAGLGDLVNGLERFGALARGQAQSASLVCRAFGGEYGWNIRNSLLVYFQQEISS